jgi:hypothetical protein
MCARRYSVRQLIQCFGNVVILVFAALSTGYAQQTAVRPLERGKPIQSRISGTESHSYEVRLAGGQVLRARFDQRGIDIVVDVFGPGGEKIGEFDSPSGSSGPEAVEVEAKSSGVYRLVVRPFEPDAAAGEYEGNVLAILEPEQYAKVVAAAKARHDRVPAGWIAPAMASRDCQIANDTSTAHSGRASARVQCVGKDALGFEISSSFDNLIQRIRADDYRGKRARLSAWIKPSQVESWSKLWMRVDSAERTLTFDRMDNRPVQGTGDWQKREIVLDVPQEAVAITFGLMLAGKGTVWVDDVRLEVVGGDVPSTNMADEVALWNQKPWTQEQRDSIAKSHQSKPKQPINPGFEQ